MRRIALIIAPLVLVGCSSQPAEKAADAEPAEMNEAVAMVTANGSPPGTYEVTDAKGNVTNTVLNADGTYKDLAADGALRVEGTWAVAGGKTCFSPTTEGAPAGCFAETIRGEIGSFTATGDDGSVLRVKPVAAK